MRGRMYRFWESAGVSLMVILLSVIGINRSEAGIANPDFAFPEEVRKNALPEYEKALKASDGLTALLCANELTLADRLTSSDSIGVALARYVAIEKRCHEPYSSLALLMQARMLSDVYQSNRFTFNQRELPDSDLNEEPMLWSGSQMRNEIGRLLRKVLDAEGSLRTHPLTEISLLLANPSVESYKDMTCFDFAIYQAIDIADNTGIARKPASSPSIPFVRLDSDGDNSGIKDGIGAHFGDRKDKEKDDELDPLRLLDLLIAADSGNSPDSEALFTARVRKLDYMNTSEDRYAYSEGLLRLYPDGNPLRPQLIAILCLEGALPDDTDSAMRRRHELLRSALADYPDSKYRGCLKNLLDELVEPRVNISFPDQWLSDTPGRIAVNYSNMKDAHLLLVPIGAVQAESDNLRASSLKPTGRIIDAGMIKGNLSVPYTLNDTVSVNGLKPGYYAVVCSADATLAGQYPQMKKTRPAILNVSDIAMFIDYVGSGDDSSGQSRYAGNTRVVVVDARNGAPLSGAKVRFVEPGRKGRTKVVSTDKNGSAVLPFDNAQAYVSYETNRINQYVYRQGDYYYSKSNKTANILTDLAIYHPGDTVKCVAIAANIERRILSAADSLKISILLKDANYKVIDTRKCLTGNMGRAYAEFPLPAEGLNGVFTLQAECEGRIIASTRFRVEDYKAPTFFVALDPVAVESANTDSSGNSSDSSGGVIRLRGKVMTYSGMPLASTPVGIEINYSPRFRMWMNSWPDSHYGATTTTDEAGVFTLLLSSAGMIEKGYGAGVFNVRASATSEAGETRSSAQRDFTLGRGFTLVADLPRKLEASGDTLNFNVRAADFVGSPVVKRVAYEFRNTADVKVALSGEFNTPLLSLPSAGFPSGEYSYRLILPGACKDPSSGKWAADTVSGTITLWRKTDLVPPVKSALWIPELTMYAEKGEKEVPVRFGNSFADGHVFCQIADTASVIRKVWIEPGGKMTGISVPAPGPGNEMRVCFYSIHDLNPAGETVVVRPAEANVSLEIIPETFRDKVAPLASEKWTFRIRRTDGRTDSFAAAAVMTDKSLNAITPFNWIFNPESMIGNKEIGRTIYNTVGRAWLSLNLRSGNYASAVCPVVAVPGWNLWGMDLGRSYYGNIRIRGTRMMNSAVYATGAVKAKDELLSTVMPTEMVLEESAPAMSMKMDADMADVEAEYAGGAEGTTEESPIEVRESECPIAFFKPALLSGEAGVVDIDFVVPNFNTTWVLQLLGYDSSMKSAISVLESVASKPVMVSANAPSFMLTGDKTGMSAMVFNNTAEACDIRGRLEVIDAASGRVLAFSEETFRSIAPAASEMLSLTFDVPDNVSAVYVKATATSDAGSDGERTLLPVIPSSTPVSDGYTIYLSPENPRAEIAIPKLNHSDMVSLNYCRDPKWFAVTQLSGLLQPDSESATVISDALFANALTSGIIAGNSYLREGIKKMLGNLSERALVSPLTLNQELKNAPLSSTPWVNNADSETLRMAGLADYLSSGKGEKNMAALIGKLRSLQGASGGWSWMKKMPESAFITDEVLGRMAQLNNLGYLPKGTGLTEMLGKGLAYSDSEQVKDYKRWLTEMKAPYPLLSELNHIYMREMLTSFPGEVNAPAPGEIQKMKQDLLKRLPEEWKMLSLPEKVRAAELLELCGNHQLASQIMKSVLEFASYKPSKGMWFDIVEEKLGSATSLGLVASCVNALRRIAPSDPALPRMVQYLILSRQTADWSLGMNSGSVAAVASAVLTSSDLFGDDSESSSTVSAPEIYIDDKRLEIDSSNAGIAGNIFLNLRPEDVSGKKLRFESSGEGIAWGGVLTQYVEKISRVKAHSVEQLKITKALLPVSVGSDGMKVGKPAQRFSKEDRIRVTLTIINDRPLDYVLIQDQIGSFMQRSEQLTEYKAQDGIWMLMEPRTSTTNFYITSLPKGKHILSYEVIADRDGEYSSGIAAAQSLYYPFISAHSAGMMVTL